jgi:predicted transglutaminase-like cysteine proteinase
MKQIPWPRLQPPPVRSSGLLLAVTTALFATALLAQALADLGFATRVSARLISAYVAKFGAPAQGRLEAWKKFSADLKDKTLQETERLVVINRYLNRIRFIGDERHWGLADYWATPAESVASDGGDCEDFSIAKYFLLKELGVPVAKLRLVYVKSVKLNQAHMVVAYYSSPNADPLVLDNLEDTVRPASQRSDLIPVYSFNDEEVWVEAKGKIGSPRQIRNWSALLERLEREARI